jgi:hypothetical protein
LFKVNNLAAMCLQMKTRVNKSKPSGCSTATLFVLESTT